MASNKVASHLKFRIELIPPVDPNDISNYFERFKCLLKFTNKFSLASHAVGVTISGFDRGYNLAKFLLNKEPQVDILFHLTCNDLNRVNIDLRLELLRNLGVKRLLIISGEGYSISQNFKRLHFANSSELVCHISTNFSSWFETVAVAGYPTETDVETSIATTTMAFIWNNKGELKGDQSILIEVEGTTSDQEGLANNDLKLQGKQTSVSDGKGGSNISSSSDNNSGVCSRYDCCSIYKGNKDRDDEAIRFLDKKIHLSSVNSIYTQCVFDSEKFKRFRDKIRRSKFAAQLDEVVPSVAIFRDQATLERVVRLTRVNYKPTSLAEVKSNIIPMPKTVATAFAAATTTAVNDENCNVAEIEPLRRIKTLGSSSKEAQKSYSKKFIIELCKNLKATTQGTNDDLLINLCTFNLFEFTFDIIEELNGFTSQQH